MALAAAKSASWSPGAVTPPKPPTVEERLTALEKRVAVLEGKGV
jgi:hypothetical protein